MSNVLNVKTSGGDITLPILANAPSKPYMGIKGKGYIPLSASGTGAGVYTKINGTTYKLQSAKPYLEFASDRNFTLKVATPYWDGIMEYSTDGGVTWTTWDGSELSGTSSQPILVRGTGNTVVSHNVVGRFYSTTMKYVRGSLENLLDYQTVLAGNHPQMGSRCFVSMFYNCTSLVEPPELPVTELTDYCYMDMFYGCADLTRLPELPATTGATYCYFEMFAGCRSIKLSSTQTGDYQYPYRIPTSGTGTGFNALDLADMFNGTGGTFTGTPSINTTYYTDHEPISAS